MGKYLIEETLSPQAFAGMLQNPEDRNKVLKPVFEVAGCRLEQFYVSGIENKAYLVVESPDLNSVYTVGAAVMAGGAVLSLKYTPLLTVPKAADLCKKAAGLGFRPPGK
ncbi:MAG: GYD domain-containing protein [Chloroflexota bacterium]|nr:MAG: GYD domain-containing protein [Chloroflexota bacterium]